MAVERYNLGKKTLVVGIRLDGHAKELIDWAIMKVARYGDHVVAIHVCRNSGCFSNERALLDGYLDDCQVLCNKKQVDLSAEILRGNSIRKVLVREANKFSASAVIVGITRNSVIGGWASVAKYCIKKLPPTTEIMVVHNAKLIFSRCSGLQLQECEDPDPSLMSKDDRSEFGESDISEMSRNIFHGRGVVGLSSRDEVLSSISLPVEDFKKQRPGWPLLRTVSSITQPAQAARNMSVVQWVMSLPRRSLSEVSESNFHASKIDEYPERKNGKLAEMSSRNKLSSQQELLKDLEPIIKKNPAGCQVFCYDVLKMSTSEFASGNLIGKGGCNSVYKGVLPDGKIVAVKILKSSKESWKDFVQEVDIMTTLQHNKIVPLLGICITDNELISVYDFFPRGNLEENLHSNKKENSVLSWEVRFRIAVGVAEALNYLHNECTKPIVHRDIKSSNILLTDEFEPQLCDFGLAIWGPKTASFLMDNDVVGTFGYLAPEYFMYGKVSDKIDVYAFGVVLLELLSGRRAIGLETRKHQESLVMWAKPNLENGDLKSILDPNLDENVDEAQMQRMALAAKLCITQAARLRPKMRQILDILNGVKYNDELKPEGGNFDDSETRDDHDDEVYPDSSAESHLSLAFLDVNDNSTSFSSLDQVSPLSVTEYLNIRWSRSSSLE